MRYLLTLCFSMVRGSASGPKQIEVRETDDYLPIDTDALQAKIRKKGYVSGVAQGSLLDK